jgi:hypothetical protein
LARRIRKDFPQPGSAPEVLRLLADLAADSSDPMLGTERVLAAVVLLAAGSIKELRSLLALARTDWRDLLVAAQLAEADWPARLDAELSR